MTLWDEVADHLPAAELDEVYIDSRRAALS